MSRTITFAVVVATVLLLATVLGAGVDSVPVAAAPLKEGDATGHAVFLPLVVSDRPLLRISALHYDTEIPYEPDEAFQLWNVSGHDVDLAGYGVSDGLRTVVFPRLTLAACEPLWCTRTALSFTLSFGFRPACEYGGDSDPTVPNLSGTALRFGNSGGQATLRNPAGRPIDLLVYEGGDTAQDGWSGPAVDPYTPNTGFGTEGQVLYRKLDLTGDGPPQPVADTDTRADWAQDPDDHLLGRRVQYAGWDLLAFARPPVIAASGALTVALGPDNLYEAVSETLADAQQSIRLEVYSLEHVALAELLAARAAAGVSVTVLLEGAPSGGIEDQERYAAQLIEAAGGQVWFMVNDRNGAADRYRYQHAKFAVVDERLLLVGSENFSPSSMPDDDKSDGTQGRRGAALITDDAALVNHALDLFAADFDPANHVDLFRWSPGDPVYGAPPPGFVPQTGSGGSFYQPVHSQPLTVSGDFAAQVVQAPEAALLPPERGGLLGLLADAGVGDTVLVQQLYERVHWGGASDTPESAPNPRLEAMIDAARRGARVRIMLDGYFDDGENVETLAYVTAIAQAEGLDLAAVVANPTGSGVHNKMVLAHIAGSGWVHVGSLNGSEASAKANRELALQVQSDDAFDYLAAAFWHDWNAVGGGLR